MTCNGKLATRAGDYIVFQDTEGVDPGQYEIYLEENAGRAQMAGRYICIDQDGYFNLKNEGVYALIRLA